MEVQFFSLLRRITNTPATEVEGKTVREVLGRLVQRYGPVLAEEIFDPRGEVKPMYNILVNGRNIAFLEGLETRLNSSDRLTIIPPAAGG